MKCNFSNLIGIQFVYNRYSIFESPVRLNVSVIGNIQPSLFLIAIVLTVLLIQKKDLRLAQTFNSAADYKII